MDGLSDDGLITDLSKGTILAFFKHYLKLFLAVVGINDFQASANNGRKSFFVDVSPVLQEECVGGGIIALF